MNFFEVIGCGRFLCNVEDFFQVFWIDDVGFVLDRMYLGR